MPDGVEIVYSAAGAGETARLFIHGGLADRTYFDLQFRRFAGRYRVVAPDLGGHGESGGTFREYQKHCLLSVGVVLCFGWLRLIQRR